ncbi:nuclear factor 7, ovary-like [Mantella aurantiaca]
MASADLRKELDCSICLNIYTDPVNLRCGHNFCRVCIDRVLDTQGGSGGYSCPECREEFQERPALYRNVTLRNIVDNFRSTQPDDETLEVFCNHCVDFPVLAVKSCLHCEASLCDKHLRVHSKSPEHVLCDPTTSLESRKCPIHMKILEYYCTVDGSCICLACRLDGAHHGHQVKTLAKASEKKKDELKTVQQKLSTKQKKVVKRIHRLQEHKRNEMQKAEEEKAKVTVQLGDLRRQLEDLEKRVLGDVSRQADRVSRSINDLTRELEVMKDELSRKMRHIDELCNMADPLTILQEADTGDLCDTEDGDDEIRERYDELLHDGGNLDVAGISHTLHTGIQQILEVVNTGREETEDLLLDENTAGGKLQISDDGKSVTALPSPDRNLPKTPKRFQYSLVMSRQGFSSGQHFWDVNYGRSSRWDIGMCYPSVDRGWNAETCIQKGKENCEWENNDKCWSLKKEDYYEVFNEKKQVKSCSSPCSNRIRIYLDYEAGKISFYNLVVPIRVLHTFTTTFTEPLHVMIGVWDDYGHIEICGGWGRG